MSKMKKGTNVGLDKNYNNVRVGDTVIDKDGAEYSINAYGMAVAPDGKSRKLSEVKDFEVKKQDEQPAEEKPAKKHPIQMVNLRSGIEGFTDEQLVEELRRRGWAVACTKKVEKIVYKTVKL